MLPEPVVEALGADPVTGAWLGRLLGQFGGALRRLRKLHFKNLGALLALGERIDPELSAAPGGEGGAETQGGQAPGAPPG
ncbi:MAG TPA: hypothetical protein VFS43_18540 [Polyangiaceae bacterium]|nr:hypothetical protein [Polyangiaceae bacterium]